MDLSVDTMHLKDPLSSLELKPPLFLSLLISFFPGVINGLSLLTRTIKGTLLCVPMRLKTLIHLISHMIQRAKTLDDLTLGEASSKTELGTRILTRMPLLYSPPPPKKKEICAFFKILTTAAAAATRGVSRQRDEYLSSSASPCYCTQQLL